MKIKGTTWSRALGLTLALGGGLAAVDAEPVQEGRAIAERADAKNRNFADETVDMTMVLVNANGDSTLRRMKSMTLERNAAEDYSLIQFVEPPDVRGTGLLTWQNPKSDDRQWLYLPELRRVKTIASKNKSGSFMGSEFAYEDISGNTLEKFTYKLVGEEKWNGEDCWVLEKIPAYPNSGYTKVKTWVAKSDDLVRKQEFTDRKHALLKTQTFKGWKTYESPMGKTWRADEITVENMQSRKKSILRFSNRKMASGLKEESFNERNLQRIQF